MPRTVTSWATTSSSSRGPSARARRSRRGPWPTGRGGRPAWPPTARRRAALGRGGRATLRAPAGRRPGRAPAGGWHSPHVRRVVGTRWLAPGRRTGRRDRVAGGGSDLPWRRGWRAPGRPRRRSRWRWTATAAAHLHGRGLTAMAPGGNWRRAERLRQQDVGQRRSIAGGEAPRRQLDLVGRINGVTFECILQSRTIFLSLAVPAAQHRVARLAQLTCHGWLPRGTTSPAIAGTAQNSAHAAISFLRFSNKAPRR